MMKKYGRAKVEEIQAQSRSHKKLDYLVSDTGVSSFSRRDRVKLGFEI
jgi:hypothetical protein